MKTWYVRYGFDESPLSVDPEASEELVEYQEFLDELLYRIQSGSMAFIEGAHGMGKSALLAQAIHVLAGQGKVIYYDCSELKKRVPIDDLMKNRYGVWGRLTGTVPKDMVVLLDNIEELSRENAERIKYYFDQNNIKSVVFTGLSFANAKLPQSIKDRIGMHVITLRPLSDYGAVELIAARLGEHGTLISDEAVKYLFAQAKKNTGQFLTLCERVCVALLPRTNTIMLDDAKKVLRNG